MRYGIGEWDCTALGNHRAVVRTDEAAEAVWAHIPWRRRDHGPEKKNIVVICAATGERIRNVARVDVEREFGDLVFEAATPGEYHVYYLPLTHKDDDWMDRCFPNIAYPPPEDTPDPAWLERCGLAAPEQLVSGDWMDLPHAQVVEIQAINEFHRFDPMEVIATDEETAELLDHYADRPYLLFPEDRRYPIRMKDDLPLRWIEAGPHDFFHGEAARGEFYALQIGVYAAQQDLTSLTADVTDLHGGAGDVIPADAVRCTNLGGIDWLGRPFSKEVSLPRGQVQALWFGVEVPREAKAGHYEATVTIRPADAPPTDVTLSLTVTDDVLENAGDCELWRQSRLRWLDSTIGLDDDVVEPFTPVEVEGRAVKVLGRELDFDEVGLPEAIRSTFPKTLDRVDAEPQDILAAPMRFVVETGDGPVAWSGGKPKLIKHTTGAAVWEADSVAGGLKLHTWARMECDGYVNYKLTLTATRPATLKDVALEVPLRREIATYMMGLGCKGGYRPTEWRWEWNIERSNNQFWIGDVNAGLSCKLKHVEEDWALHHLKRTGVYRDWGNDGRGACMMREEGDDTVLVRAYTAERAVEAGEQLHFNFGLLITPIKMLDKAHWQWRYGHHENDKTVEENTSAGAKIINLHQGDKLNPYINYPFLTTDALSAYVDEAHARGLKVKLYYTIRELSNYVAEIWALRSLGDEVFAWGPGFADAKSVEQAYRNHTGDSWLCEHLVTDYLPAWHQPLGPGHCDAALETVGLSRWHNYYLEGLNRLIRNVGIDGLYLDGIGYDREVMKRVRKVMEKAKPGCLIDFHNGNSFHPQYGMNNCANHGIELLPYVDSIWFGEGFDYDETPEYWLVEISGIPYGLFGEMLQSGIGTPWRGMIYGMSNRLGWYCNPAPIWKVWDDFGIEQADMIGYWVPECPVKTDHPNVLATVYRRKERTLVSIATWAKERVEIHLKIDWDTLGIDADRAKITAPAVKDFQDAATFTPSDAIPVEPGRGWLLIVDQEG